MNTAVADKNYVVGSFDSREGAERAFHILRDMGYTSDEIDVMMSDRTRESLFVGGPDDELATKTFEGAGIGGAIGITLGAIIAAVAAVGSVVVPGVGLLAAGPIAAALAGAGAGGLSGGILGALIGAGLPDEHADQLKSQIEGGKVILGVKAHSEGEARSIKSEWRRESAFVTGPSESDVPSAGSLSMNSTNPSPSMGVGRDTTAQRPSAAPSPIL